MQEHQSSKIVITTESPGELITLSEMERRYVRQVLAAVGGNKTHAARILGIDRRSLYRRLEEPRKDKSEKTASSEPQRDRPITNSDIARNGAGSSNTNLPVQPANPPSSDGAEASFSLRNMIKLLVITPARASFASLRHAIEASDLTPVQVVERSPGGGRRVAPPSSTASLSMPSSARGRASSVVRDLRAGLDSRP